MYLAALDFPCQLNDSDAAHTREKKSLMETKKDGFNLF